MRELKFRAWDGSQMLTEENFDFVVSDYNSIIRLDEYGWTEHWVDCVEQYTGLKDKNGREIYEGDILESTWNCDRAVVIWNDVEGEWEHYADFNTHSKYSGSIIIGNIHENPELLKEEE